MPVTSSGHIERYQHAGKLATDYRRLQQNALRAGDLPAAGYWGRLAAAAEADRETALAALTPGPQGSE